MLSPSRPGAVEVLRQHAAEQSSTITPTVFTRITLSIVVVSTTNTECRRATCLCTLSSPYSLRRKFSFVSAISNCQLENGKGVLCWLLKISSSIFYARSFPVHEYCTPTNYQERSSRLCTQPHRGPQGRERGVYRSRRHHGDCITPFCVLCSGYVESINISAFAGPSLQHPSPVWENMKHVSPPGRVLCCFGIFFGWKMGDDVQTVRCT